MKPISLLLLSFFSEVFTEPLFGHLGMAPALTLFAL